MDGALNLDPGDLTLRDVDIQDQHLYPISIGKLQTTSPPGWRRQDRHS